jgi:pimeloyl-ACP methyl ester carboxylesterase
VRLASGARSPSRLLALAIAAALVPIPTPRAICAVADSSRLSFQPYVIKALDGAELPAELGRLTVPELHANPTGRTITVAFVRLRSTAVTPGPPIVFLPGGPGFPGTLLARTPAYLRFFERLRTQSDVLVLDQRGSGFSVPTLQCATKGSLARDAFESEPKIALALGGMVRPCLRLVRGDGIAPEAYNTVEAAEDLETLRGALGAERLRLIGVSYGTEVALEAIRRHEDRIDRAVLAGTRGPDMVLSLPSTSDIQLKRLSGLIAADASWGRELPDFEGLVRRTLETLARRPASIEIVDVKTRGKTRVLAGPIAVQAFLASDLNDWTRTPFLPAIFATLSRGDSTLFARRIEDLANSTAAGISIMQVATDCASGGSPERRSRAGREAGVTVLGNARNLLMNPAFCDLVGVKELPAAFRERIYGRTPVLFLSGSLDAITPPFQAEEVRWGFPNGIHIIVENGLHETLAFQEPQDAAADYLAGQELRGRRVLVRAMRFASIAEAKAFGQSR